MKEFAPASIRNVALVGHGGAGKTSLAEAILWTAKATSRLGKVDDGTSTLDHDTDEIERKITISLGLAQFEYKNCKINMIDTPGYLDFAGDVAAGLRAADSAILVVRGPAGVEVGTEIVWGHVTKRGIPAMIAVTMMDKEHANFQQALDQAIERISPRCAALWLPIGEGEGFKGAVDVLTRKAFTLSQGNGAITACDLPADMTDVLDAARSRLMDAIAETDEALMDKYLGGEELSEQEMVKGLRAAVVTGGLIPVIPVSAGRVQGTTEILDSLILAGPSPLEARPPVGHAPNSDVEKQRLPSEALCAFAFKTVSEAHMGDMLLLRCYSGALETGSDVWNANAETSERMGALYNLIGKDRHECGKIPTGDIGAAVKLKTTHTGHTLCTKDLPIILPATLYPEPMLCLSVKPHSKDDEEKVGSGLHKLTEEDPTLQVKIDDMHQTLLFGVGETQIEVAVKRLRRRSHVEVDLVQPKVPYRETIRAKVQKEYRHKKQSGGRGQFAEAHLRLEPGARGAGFSFLDEVVGGVVPRQFIPAVEKGVREAMAEGVMAGYPVVDVTVALFFGKDHPVDSSEMAFKIAGSQAFKLGFQEAKPVILEPVVEAEIVVPDEYMGDVMGDVSTKRGKVLGMESDGKWQRIKAHVPQAELFKYSTHLRALTQGRAKYSTKFSHYDEVPREIADKIIAAHQAEREKERVG